MDMLTQSLLIIALLIGFGLISAYLFRKIKVPDAMLLLLLGILLKHLGLLPKLSLESDVMRVLMTLALIYIVFTGGFPIRIKAAFSSARNALLSSFLNVLIITTTVGGISYLFFNDIRISLSLGFLLCVMDSTVINSILDAYRFSKKSEAFVQIESAIIDIFVIVAIISMWVETVDPGGIAQQIAKFFLLSISIGVLAGIIFSLMMKKLENVQHISLATLASLILIYVISEEYLGANGVITIFAFAITIGNLKSLTKLIYKDEAKDLGAISREQIFFFNEFSFILRCLLFIYLGTLIDFSLPYYLLLGALFALIAIIARSFIFRIISLKALPEKERNMIHIMAVKGLTVVVMMTLIRGADRFNNVLIGAIFTSLLLSSILFFFIEKDKFTSISNYIFPPKRPNMIKNMKEVSHINSFEKY